jgi:hypothetical protein
VGRFEFLRASSLVDGVVPATSSGQALSVVVVQAERRISRYDGCVPRKIPRPDDKNAGCSG